MSTSRITLTAVLFVTLIAALPAAAAPAQTTDPVALERARAEAERARADAERARAEAERAEAEVEALRAGHFEAPVAATVVEEGPDPGAYTRDGFFLRLTTGMGYSAYRTSGVAPVGDGTVRDPSGDSAGLGAHISIGGIVAPDFALHFDMWGTAGPVKPLDGVDLAVANGTYGVGVTWYWMPWNVYLTGAVGSAWTWYDTPRDIRTDEDVDSHSATGVGTYLMAGKEWWVSENWSLGVGLRLDYAWTENDDIEFHHVGAQALFSATFN